MAKHYESDISQSICRFLFYPKSSRKINSVFRIQSIRTMAQHQASMVFYCKSKEKNFPYGAAIFLQNAFKMKSSEPAMKNSTEKIFLGAEEVKDPGLLPQKT